jgi:hypothetical protein
MFTFACASVEGLTLNQKRETIAALRASIKQEVIGRRIAKQVAKDQKAANRATKQAASAAKKLDRIAKLEAKLSALKNPVGTKAVKANRKAGAVTVTKFQVEAREANDIAMKIAAKKKSA